MQEHDTCICEFIRVSCFHCVGPCSSLRSDILLNIGTFGDNIFAFSLLF